MLKELIAVEKVKLDDADERKLKVSYSVSDVKNSYLCRIFISSRLSEHCFRYDLHIHVL